MYPVLGHVDALGGTIRTYPVLVIVAALAGMAVTIPRLRRMPGIDGRILGSVIIWSCAGAWLGGRLHHLANVGAFGFRRIFVEGHWGELFGTSFHAGGAILGLIVAALVVTRRHRIHLGRFGDAVVPGFGLGLVIGRFACFLNGCCCGTPCDHFWCVPFPAPTNVWNYHVYLQLVPDDSKWSAPVHPLQLYFTAVGVLVVLLGRWLEPRRRFDGEVALVALLIVSASNAALESFRGFAPIRRYWFGVPQLTWVALATMLGTLVALVYFELRHRDARTKLPAEVAA
jgi:phosphatidylglycerol:prolipoprotein diacylglycerol transferase